MTCQAMPRTRQPAMPAPGRPGRARRDAAAGTVPAASGTVPSDVPRAPAMPGVPWWGMVSAAVAPVLLISGWTFAAGLQRGTYNAVADTVSALAAEGAADRWVMTLAFLAAGAFEVVTGLSLRPAAAAGRLILMAGGVASLLVAASPHDPFCDGALAILAQLPVQRGAADAEVGGDLFGDRAVPDPLGDSGAGGRVKLRGASGGQPAGLSGRAGAGGALQHVDPFYLGEHRQQRDRHVGAGSRVAGVHGELVAECAQEDAALSAARSLTPTSPGAPAPA